MLARDVMTRNVITVSPETAVSEIARTLVQNRISAVPVTGADGAVLGIVSEGDLMRRPETGTEAAPAWWLALFETPEAQATEYARSHGLRAGDVMTREVVTVAEDAPLAEIATLLERRRIKRVPVVYQGRLVGVVSRANLIQGLATWKSVAAEGPTDGDRAIRESLLETIRDKVGARVALIDVTVTGGAVHIWGIAESEAEKRAVRIAAETAPGVVSVMDHSSVLAPNVRAAIWAD